MVEGGSVIAAFFLAHNYVSEQFGNYVVYGMSYYTLGPFEALRSWNIGNNNNKLRSARQAPTRSSILTRAMNGLLS